MLFYFFGPLIKVWSLRGESKHQPTKQCLRVKSNYVNPGKTAAYNCQLSAAYYLNSTDLLSDLNESYKIKDMPNSISQRLQEKYELYNDLDLLLSVTHKGVNFENGDIVPVRCLECHCINTMEILNIILDVTID